MRFITYVYNEEELVGFVEDGRIYGVEAYDMVGLMGAYGNINFGGIRKKRSSLRIEEVEVLSPIVKPIHDVICVGRNYEDHIIDNIAGEW